MDYTRMSIDELEALVAQLYERESDANAERKRATAVLRIRRDEAAAADAVEKAKGRLAEVQQKIKKPSFFDRLRNG